MTVPEGPAGLRPPALLADQVIDPPGDEVTADLAALATGFSVAVDDEAVVGQDGFGTPVIDVPSAGWTQAARHARDVLGMDYLDWLSAVDQPDAEPPGLDVVLHVASSQSAGPPSARRRPPLDELGRPGLRRVRRILLRTRVPDVTLRLPSLTPLWPGVAWHERETFEMFGLLFEDFADDSGRPIRPLLLPDGFEGTPLRKSFVLAARVAKPWPGAKEPGESGAGRPGRRRLLPPGVPGSDWGPREPTPGGSGPGSAAGSAAEPDPSAPS